MSAVLRHVGDHAVGFVKLLVVDRASRRHGHGRALLAAAEQWAWDSGATELHLSGSAPAYLWPGVDVRATAMLCLAEAAGYDETGAAFDMSVPAAFRQPVPEGVEIRRTLADTDAAAVDALVERRVAQLGRRAATGRRAGHVPGRVRRGERRRGRVRLPLGEPGRLVRPDGHGTLAPPPLDRPRPARRGLHRPQVAGFTDVEICWIGPVGFYAAAGGSISRTYRTYRRRKP